jgi:hypothetical protein
MLFGSYRFLPLIEIQEREGMTGWIDRCVIVYGWVKFKLKCPFVIRYTIK